MTAIRAVHIAPRQRASSQNGLPEPVPYVYGQQTRRNTYAARIARRNVQGWWQPPAALPEPKLTRPQAQAGTAAEVNLVLPSSGWAEILTLAHGKLHRADLERDRSERVAEALLRTARIDGSRDGNVGHPGAPVATRPDTLR